MGRLENFIPKLKPHQLTQEQQSYNLQFEGQAPIKLKNTVQAFIKQVNGHLCLKEIFEFLNSKGETFSIEQSLGLLHHLAEKKLLSNSDDYFKLTSPQVLPNQGSKNTTQLEKSYFSHERLMALIQKTTLFLQCDRKTAELILKHSRLEKIEPGTCLIKKGTKSSFFYILLSGEAGVYWKKECLSFLGPLSIFGESAAIFDRPRNADVVAVESCWALKVDASQVVDTQTGDGFDGLKGLKSRLILNQTLASNPLFKSLPTDILQLFIAKCRIEKWGKEQTIIEQDENSGDFYFILQGSVAIIKNGLPVTSLSEGDHFGEVAALLKQPRTASVLSETSCTLLVLNQQSLFSILCSHLALAVDIEKTAQKRMSDSGNILEIFDQPHSLKSKDQDLDHESGVFEIDQEFLEVSQTNFDLEVFDFSQTEDKAS